MLEVKNVFFGPKSLLFTIFGTCVVKIVLPSDMNAFSEYKMFRCWKQHHIILAFSPSWDSKWMYTLENRFLSVFRGYAFEALKLHYRTILLWRIPHFYKPWKTEKPKIQTPYFRKNFSNLYSYVVFIICITKFRIFEDLIF